MAADTFAILATGPSMGPAVVERVRGAVERGACRAIAVSDAFKLAPWAEVLVSHDAAWWEAHPEALAFSSRKVTGHHAVRGCDVLRIGDGSNSGLLACHVATNMGARRLLLLGFDMHGSHFFGPHPAPLKNTTAARFDVFREQFRYFRPPGVEILNCTPGSALDVFPRAELDEVLP